MEEFNVEGNNIGQLPVRIHSTLFTLYTVYTLHCVHFTLNLYSAWTLYRYWLGMSAAYDLLDLKTQVLPKAEVSEGPTNHVAQIRGRV